MVWEAISKTQKSVSSGIQTPRSRLKKLYNFSLIKRSPYAILDTCILYSVHNFNVCWPELSKLHAGVITSTKKLTLPWPGSSKLLQVLHCGLHTNELLRYLGDEKEFFTEKEKRLLYQKHSELIKDSELMEVSTWKLLWNSSHFWYRRVCP